MMRRIGRYSPHLSQDQRDAVTRAMFAGMTAAEVVVVAAAGELEGLAPFDVSETACRDLRAEAERTNGAPEPGPPANQAEADEKAYLKAQVSRVKAIAEPSAKDLSVMQSAMRALNDIDKRAARRAAPRPQPKRDEPSDLAKRLLAELNAEDEPRRPDLEGRRHQLARRWVKASLRMTRAQHPDWDTLTICNHAATGRPRPLDQQWRDLGGNRPHHDLTPEAYDELSDLLDREETELAELETQVGHHP